MSPLESLLVVPSVVLSWPFMHTVSQLGFQPLCLSAFWAPLPLKHSRFETRFCGLPLKPAILSRLFLIVSVSHKPRGSNNKYLFLAVLETHSPRSRCQPIKFPEDTVIAREARQAPCFLQIPTVTPRTWPPPWSCSVRFKKNLGLSMVLFLPQDPDVGMRGTSCPSCPFSPPLLAALKHTF